jgi:hypothetical protein
MLKAGAAAVTALAALVLLGPTTARRRADSPLDRLPPNVEVLTHFGERADISPDNRRVAFMAKSFGDAFVVDLETRVIRCLTCNVPGAAFLRVMHLPSSDFLLIGPERFEDVGRSRSRDNELWLLSRKPGSRPVKLGRRMIEGAAVSKRSTKIGFNHSASIGFYNEVEGIFADGRFMAFQVARTADEAGVGYGILMLRFPPLIPPTARTARS